jgi:hypothetical protein
MDTIVEEAKDKSQQFLLIKKDYLEVDSKIKSKSGSKA